MTTNICHECNMALHRIRPATDQHNNFWYCEEHYQEWTLPETIAEIPEDTLSNHVIRIRLINGPRDYVAYFGGWYNSGTANSPRWIATTTRNLDNAAILSNPLDEYHAVKASIGPSAMAFLSTLEAETDRDPDIDALFIDKHGDTYYPEEVGF